MSNYKAKRARNEKPKRKKKKSAKKILLKIIIAIVIILVILFGIAAGFIWSKLSEFDYVKIETEDIETNEEVELKGIRNIAIFGIDARSDTYENGRSDAIIIASINENTKQIKLISVYRDTYVNIDGYGLDKITHAYAYGGPRLAINTLNKNFDLNITEFVTVNFEAVVDIIDAVDGVKINIESDELKYINSYIAEINKQTGRNSKKVTKTGLQTLDGVQALAYSRIRYTEGGDYKRTERMRNVLNAGFEEIKSLSVGELSSLATKLLPKVSTNISKTEMITLAPVAVQYKVTDSVGWPYEVKGITLEAWYGVPVILESNVTKLHKEVFGEEDYTPSTTVKEISNKIINKTGYR